MTETETDEVCVTVATLISFSLSRTAALRDQRSFLKLGRPHANHMQTTCKLLETSCKLYGNLTQKGDSLGSAGMA